MNIYLRELKSHRKSIIIWCFAMIFLVAMESQEYSSMMGSSGNSEAMMDLIKSMPKFLQAFFGVSVIDITSPIGYFGILFSYIVLMGAIHASTLGVNIIYKEERDKTVEFLMTKPISRKKVIISKFMAGLTNIVVLNIVTFITSIINLSSLTNDSFSKEIILSMIAMLLIQLIFMSIGMSLAMFLSKPKKANVIMLLITIGAFFLSLFIDSIDILKVFEILSPFKWFDSKDFFISYNFDIKYIILSIIVIVVPLLLSYKNYKSRDLNI
jgi:ABC-2 type transport system permease protein